jgi:hypothetical protein
LADTNVQRVGVQEPTSTAQTANSEGHRVSELVCVKAGGLLSFYMLSTIVCEAALALMQIDYVSSQHFAPTGSVQTLRCEPHGAGEL